MDIFKHSVVIRSLVVTHSSIQFLAQFMCVFMFVKPIWAKLPDSNLDDVVVDDDNDELKAKFHYAIWSQTGPKLVADLLARGSKL